VTQARERMAFCRLGDVSTVEFMEFDLEEMSTIGFRLADLWSREDNLGCISKRDLSESSAT